MKCSECGGTYTKKHGTLELTDKYVGCFTVHTIDYLRCDQCGGLLFSYDTARKVDEARERKLQGTLLSKPLGAFVNASEAADLLGISRQALHKHRRIRRGFIFHTLFGGNKVYLRESVMLFKKTGDGRFSLHPEVQEVKYRTEQGTARPVGLYDRVKMASAVWSKRAFGKSETKHFIRRMSYAQEEASAVPSDPCR